MRHVKFITAENVNTGEIGALPFIFKKWANKETGEGAYEPYQSLGHDLIDHTTKETGEIWQEFRALGAYAFNTEFGAFANISEFWGRGKSTAWKLGAQAAGNIESTIGDSSDALHCKMPMARKVHLTKKEKGNFQEFYTALCREFYANEYLEGEVKEYFHENKREILSWFKLGYVNAKRRYSGDAYSAFTTKQAIETVLNKHNNIFNQAGDVYSLGIDVSNGYVELRDHRGYQL
jgi:hypothetical protein